MTDWRCPGCGAAEAMLHALDCVNRPIAIRPCCRSPLWREGDSPHEAFCYEWGVGPRPAGRQPHYPDHPLDPFWESRIWEGIAA